MLEDSTSGAGAKANLRHAARAHSSRMSQKLLLGCINVPGWGGAATFVYTLFERLRRDGFDVEFVNMIEEVEETFLHQTFGARLGNPSALEGVHNLTVDAPLWQPQPGLAEVIQRSRPDLLVVCGFGAARMMKLTAPRVPVAFITSGCWQVKRLMREGAVDDFMDFERQVKSGVVFEAPARDEERLAAETSDLIILHSPLVRRAFEHFFADCMERAHPETVSIADCVYDEAARFAHLARPWAERDIDVILVANNWSRPEKSYPLARRIIAGCHGLEVHLVGRHASDEMPVHRHGVVARREELYALLGRSRVIAAPSAFDPAPGVLFEASAMGCNVVASPNCGNWELCAPELLAHTPDRFVDRIRRAVAAPVADNRERFRGGYDALVGSLNALATAPPERRTA